MLSPSDAQLVERDAVLPGLATLLDADALATAIGAAVPDATITAARPSYLRYKPGTNCLVAADLVVDAKPLSVYAQTYPAADRDKLLKNLERRTLPGPLGPSRIVLHDSMIAVSAFPNDAEMGSLAALHSPQGLPRVLGRLLPASLLEKCITLRRMRYKPERRYVAAMLRDGEPFAALKAYAPSAYAPARRNALALGASARMRRARVLGSSDPDAILAFEWISGRPLSDAIAAPSLATSDLALTAAAIVELHRSRPEGIPTLKRADEISRLTTKAAMLAFLCPWLATRLDELTRGLGDRLHSAPAIGQLLHGDFYTDQVILEDDAAVVTDLDRAVWGDPAADLGLFMAHLEWDHLRGLIAAARRDAVRNALLDGYGRATQRALPDRVGLYTAVGLLSLATRPFRDRDPDWYAQTAALVERAEALLDGDDMSRSRWPRVSTAKADAVQPGVRASALDPAVIARDPRMPFLTDALDPAMARRHLARGLAAVAGDGTELLLGDIRVVRHKTGRRCLIEYDVRLECRGAAAQELTIIGKARARGADARTESLHRQLRADGFDDESADGISVPEPLGIVPELRMWLQRKVTGEPVTGLLGRADGNPGVRRAADAVQKLHRSAVRPGHHHGVDEELRILRARLALVALERRGWASRLERVVDRAARLTAFLTSRQPCVIHRDFYPDQVLVARDRVYLLDLDLCCEGDPALDAGNFIAHVTEQSLRTHGDPTTLADREATFRERFLELAGADSRAAVDAYVNLALVRHIYISTLFPERAAFTEPLLELCEERLGLHGATPGTYAASPTMAAGWEER